MAEIKLLYSRKIALTSPANMRGSELRNTDLRTTILKLYHVWSAIYYLEA